MIVLGIESTCDETAISIVRNGNEILSNVIFSQTELHKKYGGVFPELACRKHLDTIFPVIDQAVNEAGISIKDVDLISVAKGPGLIGALIIGLNVAKTLSLCLNKPFIGVSHIEAHLYAPMMQFEHLPKFPCLGVVISGGHTNIVKINHLGEYQHISSTVDDAIGEAFDKAAKMLDLPYPGGPEIEKIAQLGDEKKYVFSRPFVKKSPMSFSFSGLKTQVFRTIEKLKKNGLNLETEKKHLAAGFQFAALSDIVYKTILAAEAADCTTIFLGGGVSNSSKLRELFAAYAPSTLKVVFPPKGLSLDNAAMIAGLGYHKYQFQKKSDLFSLYPSPKLPFSLQNSLCN